MPEKRDSEKKGRSPIIYVIIALGALGVILAVGGFTFAATQEEHDSFCASCHTQPESTFYERSLVDQPTDLASFHTTKSTRCIDCHSGEGITGRVSAELMGAHNALMWYTGTAVQPAVQTVMIGNDNCLKCHENVLSNSFTPVEQIVVQAERGGREGNGPRNHWHTFLTRWQTASPTEGTCVSCHSAHTTDGTAQSGFMVAQTVQDQCNACHRATRRGERG